MAKKLVIDDNLYNRIKILADKKNMKINDFLSYLLINIDDNVKKNLIEVYSEFKDILIEETGLFNYKGGQSGVYNRLKESNVNNLQDLFEKHSLRKIDYGLAALGANNYIHNEMNGIINLLSYKYLNVESPELNECLNTTINAHYVVMVSDYPTGYPGEIFKAVMRKGYPYSVAYNDVNNLLRLLKSSGFNFTCCKALIDYAFYKKIKGEKLGEFLINVDVNEIKSFFNKVPNDYVVFLNIYNILTKYYTDIFCEDKKIK